MYLNRKKFQRLFAQSGIDFKTFACKAHIGYKTLRRALDGKFISYRTIERLAYALNVSPKTLLEE